MFLKRNKLITIWGKKKTSPVIFPYNMELSKVLMASCKEARPRLTLDYELDVVANGRAFHS